MSDVVRDAIAAELAEVTRVARTPDAESGYGVDLVCAEDLTPSLDETPADSVLSLAQDLFHRITTPRGDLPDDPDYGTDVRQYLSAGMAPQDLTVAAGELASECRKDDRVRDVSVTLTAAGSELSVAIAVTPADPALQPFKLIVAVTSGEALLQAIDG